MERHARYVLVGVFSTAIIFAALIFIVWLGRTDFSRSYDEYRIVFDGPVRGLGEGGDVQFNGITMGRIQKIALDEHDPSRVITDIELRSGTPVRTSSVATMETQGISGVNIVQITAGSVQQPLLRKTSHENRPVIRSSADATSSLIPGGGKMVRSATETLDRINRLLSDRTIAELSATVHDVHLTTQEIAANRAMFGRAASTLAKLDSAASDIQVAAASVRGISEGDGRRAASDIADAAAELKLAIGQARGTLGRIDAQSEQISTTTLPDLDATMLSIQRAADSLDRLLREVRRDPKTLLGTAREKELELRP
ncbi:MlaD family protein [Sphingomonas sp. MMS24-J13]|uniref:MlaD family protein n=1 Tax=Sphingomonas sp. MMS24-J13 TaxID=3238686 RepID=UPI00384F96D1